MDTKNIPMRTTARKWVLYNNSAIETHTAVILRNVRHLECGSTAPIDTAHLRDAKSRAYMLCSLFLEDSDKFAKGSYHKIHFDLLMWSHTDTSRLFLRMCIDNAFHARFMSLSDEKKTTIVSAVRECILWMTERCAKYRLCRFDESLYPSEGRWNDPAAQKHIREIVSDASRCLYGDPVSRKRRRIDEGVPNQVYVNVQPPTAFQRFDRYPVKIGTSSTNGRMRIESEAHAALFRPLCDVYVSIGPEFKQRTQSATGVDYTDVRSDAYLFERFMHHKWDAHNNCHLVRHYKGYTHEEMFHMKRDVIQRLIREIENDQDQYDYVVRSVKPHEGKWTDDHAGWEPIF